ncbi:MAG: homocysteine S-methyltransferase family protein [Candidatus Omnitrophica bacterium]|nr:homocysteine S-methyltransferase family protein [Candidatus Omnitrophota bacterium]MCM8816223.1 homocysteine S-methyltransferase family protein [Candidatus Omnitrophota bacterium]
MMNQLEKALKDKPILLADGGWGTEIEKLVGKNEPYPEILNITRPEVIEKIAQSYVEAGADIILTNTFGGNFYKLKKYGVEDKIELINKKGVEISKKVAGNRMVFASVGPTGEILKPYGNVTEQELINCYMQQIKMLDAADGIVIETMSDINEARCALIGAKSITEKPVVVCFTFNPTASGYKTIMGNSINECTKMAKEFGATAVGSNCGSGIKDFIKITEEMKNFSDLPIWVKPNAGIPKLVQGSTLYPDDPVYMSGFIPALIKSGASIIGGCCGTTPVHIKKFAEEISKFLNKQ